MKRFFSSLLYLSLSLCLIACGEGTISCPAADSDPISNGEVTISTTCLSETPKTVWPVNETISISLEQSIYPVGTESFTVTLENSGDQTMLYGESYSFEYNNSGIWEPLKTIDNYSFNSIGYLLGPNATQTLDIGTWLLAEPLNAGTYRIVGCSVRVADSDDQLSYGGNYTEYPPYELEFCISDTASLSATGGKDTPQEGTVITDTAFWLEIDQPALGDTELTFAIVNASGSDAEILLIPTLEKMTDEGQWETVPFCDQIGFCGTPDPLPQGRKDWSEDLEYLWGGLADGDYRLSFTVTNTDRNEFTASGQFTYDDGLCSLPLTE